MAYDALLEWYPQKGIPQHLPVIYGSVDSDGIGYTEKEYQYALSKDKPIISFLHNNPEDLPKRDTERSVTGQKKFEAFRKLAQKKMCKYWKTPEELGSVVSRGLIKLQKRHPGIGWVRGNLIPSQEVSLEILELKNKIESLEEELELARTRAPLGTEGLSKGAEKFTIRFCVSSEKDSQSFMWKSEIGVTWDDIFYHISPMMINESADYMLKKYLEELIESLAIDKLKKGKETKGHIFYSYKIDDDDYMTIKVQLRALGLINKSDRNRSVKDKETYWTLTPYGDSIMNRLRAIKSTDSQ